MPAAGMKSADLKQSSRDKASASHCVTMPALTPNAWDGERLEVRSLGRQCFGFGWRKSRAWAFWACRSPKARTHPPPPPTPTPNPQNLPKVAETTCAGTRRSPTTYTRKHELSEFTLTLKQEVAAKAVSDSEKNRHCLRG